jgi:tetratricopeptide (TPR) repeat protein
MISCIYHPSFAQHYEDLVKKSYEHSDANDLPAAEECLKAAMRLEPTNKLNFALLTNLGTIQRRQGKFEDALLSYSAALNQRPEDELILINRAELYTEMNEPEKAINDYNTLLIHYPTHEQGLYNRGLLYIKTGEFILAQTDFEQIIDTYKDSFLGRFGYAILEKVRGAYDESEIIFNYLADKYPNNMRVLEERAELYFLTKRNARAMTDLNKIFAVTAKPSAELYMLRGRVKLSQYEKESAAIDFKKARDLGYDKETVERLLKETF